MTIEGEKMKIYIAGLGLIGGSFAKAALAAGHEVSGWDLDPAVRESAKAAGVAVSETPDAPVVIAALPPKAVVPWVESHAAGFASAIFATTFSEAAFGKPSITRADNASSLFLLLYFPILYLSFLSYLSSSLSANRALSRSPTRSTSS